MKILPSNIYLHFLRESELFSCREPIWNNQIIKYSPIQYEWLLVVINTHIHGWCVCTLRSLRYWFLILFDMLFIINLIYYSRQHLDEIRLDKWPWNLIFCVGTRQVGIMSQWNFSLWIYSITLIYIYRINSSKNNIKTLLRLH